MKALLVKVIVSLVMKLIPLITNFIIDLIEEKKRKEELRDAIQTNDRQEAARNLDYIFDKRLR